MSWVLSQSLIETSEKEWPQGVTTAFSFCWPPSAAIHINERRKGRLFPPLFLGAGRKKGGKEKGKSDHGLECDGIFDDLCRDDVSVGRGSGHLGGIHGLRAFRAARLGAVAGFGWGMETKGDGLERHKTQNTKHKDKHKEKQRKGMKWVNERNDGMKEMRK